VSISLDDDSSAGSKGSKVTYVSFNHGNQREYFTKEDIGVAKLDTYLEYVVELYNEFKDGTDDTNELKDDGTGQGDIADEQVGIGINITVNETLDVGTEFGYQASIAKNKFEPQCRELTAKTLTLVGKPADYLESM
jgi:hypothetical protein